MYRDDCAAEPDSDGSSELDFPRVFRLLYDACYTFNHKKDCSQERKNVNCDGIQIAACVCCFCSSCLHEIDCDDGRCRIHRREKKWFFHLVANVADMILSAIMLKM